MRRCEFQACCMKLALQMVLTDLDVAQGHGQALVTEQQLHSGKTDTSAQHPSCKGMSKLMGQDRTRTAGALRSHVQCLPDSMVGRTEISVAGQKPFGRLDWHRRRRFLVA